MKYNIVQFHFYMAANIGAKFCTYHADMYNDVRANH